LLGELLGNHASGNYSVPNFNPFSGILESTACLQIDRFPMTRSDRPPFPFTVLTISIKLPLDDCPVSLSTDQFAVLTSIAVREESVDGAGLFTCAIDDVSHNFDV
jgi:hypothetical protein